MAGINAGTAYVELVPKLDPGFASKAGSQLDAAVKPGLDRVASRFSAVGDKLIGAGKKLSLRVTLPILAIGAVAFKLASDTQESMSKVDVVFGRASKSIVAFADTAATKLGISRQEALEASATFGNLFRSLGIGQKPAADLSKGIVTLASDLASFNNVTDPGEVLLALRSGLVGEVEPLRKFGISLSQTRIEAEALSLGLVKGVAVTSDVASAQVKAEKASLNYAKAVKAHGKDSLEARDAAAAQTKAEEALQEAIGGQVPELTAAQKAQASYSVIMKDSTLAQGDFERTSGDAAGQQKVLTATFKDLGAEVGAKLLPIGTRLLSFVSSLLDGFKKVPGPVQNVLIAVAGLAAAAGPLSLVLGGVSKGISGVIRAGQGIGKAASGVPKVLSGLGRLRDGFKSTEAAGSAFSGKMGTLGGKLRGLADKFKSTALASGRFLKSVGGKALAGLKTFGASIGRAALVVVTQWVPAMASAAAATIAATWPILAIIAAIALVIAAAVLVWKKWDAIWGFIRDNPAIAAVLAILFPIPALFIAIIGGLKYLFENWRSIWQGIKDVVDVVWQAIKPIVEAGIQIITGIIDFALALIQGKWGAAWDAVLKVISGVWNLVKSVVQLQINLLIGIISGAFNFMLGVVTGAWNLFKTLASSAINAVVGFVTGLPGRIAGIASSVLNAAIGIGKAIVNGIGQGLSAVAGFVGDLAGAVTRAFKSAANAVIRLMNDAIPNSIGIGPFKVDLPDNPIPTFHRGGVVGGPANRDVLTILRGGEIVFTPDQLAALGRATATANVAPAVPAMPERAGAFAGASFRFENVENPRDVRDELSWLLATNGRV